MSNYFAKSLKRLPVGKSSFDVIIKQNYYYVDKTPYIKKLFAEDDSGVLLIARPRRFGKSLSMDTFYQFLRINAADPDDLSLQDSIFKDTKIYEDREFCHDFMGRFPVISVSFKEVEGNYYKEAVSRLAQTIVSLAEEHKYLLKSNKLDDLDKNNLLKLLNYDVLMKDPEYGALCFSIKTLSRLLFLHFNRQVIVLIDEYDVPISKAYDGGYYQEMVKLIRGMLSSALKDYSLIFKAILSGCLRVSKESIFTGFNNVDVNTVINDSGFLAQSSDR